MGIWFRKNYAEAYAGGDVVVLHSRHEAAAETAVAFTEAAFKDRIFPKPKLMKVNHLAPNDTAMDTERELYRTKLQSEAPGLMVFVGHMPHLATFARRLLKCKGEKAYQNPIPFHEYWASDDSQIDIEKSFADCGGLLSTFVWCGVVRGYTSTEGSVKMICFCVLWF